VRSGAQPLAVFFIPTSGRYLLILDINIDIDNNINIEIEIEIDIEIDIDIDIDNHLSQNTPLIGPV